MGRDGTGRNGMEQFGVERWEERLLGSTVGKGAPRVHKVGLGLGFSLETMNSLPKTLPPLFVVPFSMLHIRMLSLECNFFCPQIADVLRHHCHSCEADSTGISIAQTSGGRFPDFVFLRFEAFLPTPCFFLV